MPNPKYLLMNFYLSLLALPTNGYFRLTNQLLHDQVRDSLAVALDCDPETVQIIFERMANEDAKL